MAPWLPPAALRALAEFQALVAAAAALGSTLGTAVPMALGAPLGTAARPDPAAPMELAAPMGPGLHDAVPSPFAPTQRQFASEGSAAFAIRMRNAQVANATAIKAIAAGKSQNPKNLRPHAVL